MTIAHFPDIPGGLNRHTNNVLNRRHTQKSGAARTSHALTPPSLASLVLLPDSVSLLSSSESGAGFGAVAAIIEKRC